MVLPDKRKTKWPFDQLMADKICEEIAFGSRITAVSKKAGLPPYNVICRWRRENKDFNESVLNAYLDRQDYFKDRIFEALVSDDFLKLKKYFRKEISRSIGVRYPPDLKPKVDNRRVIHIIDTGIRRLKVRNGEVLEVEKLFDRNLKNVGIPEKD
jgi:hypothetical protein